MAARARRIKENPDWESAIGQFADHLLTNERSPHTIAGYRDDLARFTAWYHATFDAEPQLTTIGTADLIDWKRHQVEALKHEPQTVNRRVAAVRSFLRFAVDSGWSVLATAPKSIRQVRRGPKWLSVKEERALLRAVAAAGAALHGAVVVTLLKTGLRVSELVALTERDLTLSPRAGELIVRQGKGSKQRPVPVHPLARAALGRILAGKKDARVFQGQRGPLGRNAIQVILNRYGKAIGVDLSPHILRHTFAKRLIDAGTPLHVVARLMGHESTKTTEIYVTPSTEDLQSYVDRLSGGGDSD